MDSQNILYSKGKNDECLTLNYAVKPILKYIPKDFIVWCPFDLETSEFVKQIRANGNKVIATHIINGQDFYTYEPKEKWDYIISNPPFTNKRKIFEISPPKIIYVASGRLLCAKNAEFEAMRKGGGSAVAYAWFIWEKGYNGKPTIDWIN